MLSETLNRNIIITRVRSHLNMLNTFFILVSLVTLRIYDISFCTCLSLDVLCSDLSLAKGDGGHLLWKLHDLCKLIEVSSGVGTRRKHKNESGGRRRIFKHHRQVWCLRDKRNMVEWETRQIKTKNSESYRKTLLTWLKNMQIPATGWIQTNLCLFNILTRSSYINSVPLISKCY